MGDISRFPVESDLEEFRVGFESLVRLRDCPEEKLERMFLNIIEESRRDSRKHLKHAKTVGPFNFIEIIYVFLLLFLVCS